MNSVQMVGNIGQAPEFKTGSQGEFAVFSIALNESYTNREGEDVERVEWVPCVCYTPGIVQFIKAHVGAGDGVFITGKFTTRKYTLDHVVNTNKDNTPYELSRSSIEIKTLTKIYRPGKTDGNNESA